MMITKIKINKNKKPKLFIAEINKKIEIIELEGLILQIKHK